MKYKLEVYILCCDRLLYSKKSIQSVLLAKNKFINVIISDNSSSDDIQKMCCKIFPNVEYRRNIPQLKQKEHFKKIISSVKAEFFVLFHDDDLMNNNYFDILLPIIESNDEIGAIACNALIINKNGESTDKLFMNNIKRPKIINKLELLLHPYLETNYPSEIAPFPSYMYRTAFVDKSILDIEAGGKHFDLILLLDIIERSLIVWHNYVLIKYRYHEKNDSNADSIFDRISLCRYFLGKKLITKNSKLLKQFKYGYWLNWMKINYKIKTIINKKKLSWRIKVIIKFILLFKIYHALTEIKFWKTRLTNFKYIYFNKEI